MLPPERSKRPREELEVVIARARHVAVEVDLPEAEALGRLGSREVDDDVQPARERLVDVRTHVRRQDRDAVEQLHALQQVCDLDVGVAVARVRDLRALAEERIGLVEEQHGVHALGVREDAVEVLLGLSDVLVDDGREVDHVQVETEIVGDDLGRHRLAGAGVAREEAGDAAPLGRAPAEAPLVEHQLAMTRACGQLAQLCDLLAGQDEIIEPDDGGDAACAPLEIGGVLGPRARAQVVR